VSKFWHKRPKGDVKGKAIIVNQKVTVTIEEKLTIIGNTIIYCPEGPNKKALCLRASFGQRVHKVLKFKLCHRPKVDDLSQGMFVSVLFDSNLKG
jgi:hypothetical protein